MKATRSRVTPRARVYGRFCALALLIPWTAGAQPEGAPSRAGPTEASPSKPSGKPSGSKAPPHAAERSSKGSATPAKGPGLEHQKVNAGHSPAKPGNAPKTKVAAPGKRDHALAHYHRAFNNLIETELDPTESEKREKRALKALAKDRRRFLAMHRKDRQKFEDLSKEERAALEKKLKTRWSELTADRKSRAEKERSQVRAQLGKRADEGPFSMELKIHVWRVARLNYLLTLAQAREDEKSTQQAQSLLEKEEQRHKKRMTQLKNLPPLATESGGKGKAAPASAAASKPGTATPAKPSEGAPE